MYVIKNLKEFLRVNRWLFWLILIFLVPILLYYAFLWKNELSYRSKLNNLRDRGIYRDLDQIRETYRKEHPDRMSLDSFETDTGSSDCCNSPDQGTDYGKIVEKYTKKTYLTNPKKRTQAAESIKPHVEKRKGEIDDLLEKQNFLPADVHFSLNEKLPYITVRRRQSKLLHLYGYLKLYEGKEKEVLKVTRTLQEMSVSCMNEPYDTSLSIGMAIFQRSLALRQNLMYLTENRSILDRIETARMQRSFFYREMKESLQTIMAFIIPRFEEYVQTGKKITISEELPQMNGFNYVYTKPLLWKSAEKLLRNYEMAFEHAENPQLLEEKIELINNSFFNRILGYENYGRIIDKYANLFYNGTSVVKRTSAIIAKNELVSTGAKIKRYLLDHGSVPDQKLAEFFSRTDPLSQDAYKYRRTSGEILIYSVGTDYDDDNGATGEENSGENKDIVVEVPVKGNKK